MSRSNPEAQFQKIKDENPFGFDIVVEATGSPKILEDAINYVRVPSASLCSQVQCLMIHENVGSSPRPQCLMINETLANLKTRVHFLLSNANSEISRSVVGVSSSSTVSTLLQLVSAGHLARSSAMRSPFSDLSLRPICSVSLARSVILSMQRVLTSYSRCH